MTVVPRLQPWPFARFVLGAASEGFAVMRREPKAVLSWIAVWVLALVGVGVLAAVTMEAGGGSHVAAKGLLGLVRRFGPFWPFSVTALLVLWILNTATVFRAVIRPQEHGWHLFKFGPDEARLAVVTAAGVALVIVFGGVPALVLFFLIRPVFGLFPGFGHLTIDAGAIATVCLEIWIAVRLSLTAVHTFAEGRFHVVGYWRLTRGYFWRLLVSYLIVLIEVVGCFLALGVLLVIFSAVAAAIGAPHGADLLKRALLLALVVVPALFTAALFVVLSTVVSACQAHVYRAITARPWG
ncbi:MAG: hypothetical protein ABI306_06710 [Caulobacteraceae bacterium]